MPERFKGPALVIFNDPLGSAVESIGWKHERYTFGSDGVLKFRAAPPDHRWEALHLYHRDRAGRLVEIPQHGSADQLQILSFLASAEPRHRAVLAMRGDRSVISTDGGFGIIVFIVGKPADYRHPLETIAAFQEKVMSEEYSRLEAADK